MDAQMSGGVLLFFQDFCPLDNALRILLLLCGQKKRLLDQISHGTPCGDLFRNQSGGSLGRQGCRRGVYNHGTSPARPGSQRFTSRKRFQQESEITMHLFLEVTAF